MTLNHSEIKHASGYFLTFELLGPHLLWLIERIHEIFSILWVNQKNYMIQATSGISDYSLLS